MHFSAQPIDAAGGRRGAGHNPSGARPGRKAVDVATAAYALPGRVNLRQWDSPDWQEDLHNFMRVYGYVGAVQFGRRCSEKTYTNRRQTLEAAFRLLQRRVRNFDRLHQLKPGQLPVLLAAWNETNGNGLLVKGGQTQVQEFSVLRWFWRIHGINVDGIQTYVDDPDLHQRLRRVSVATDDKSWSGNGVDPDDVIKAVEAIDPVVARLINLGRTFGLRMKESMCLQPHEADKGDRLHLTKGTKTGREREIRFNEFDEDTLRKAIDEVKAQLKPGEHAAWSSRSLKQARRRIYLVLHKVGISKKGLGVTFHGLRAQWAIDQFERLTGGHQAPVRGGAYLNYSELAQERRVLSEALGHNRISVTSAYLGSFARMRDQAEYRFHQSWSTLEPLLPAMKMVLDDHKVANLWFVGRRACGADATMFEDWEFLLDDTVTEELGLKVRKALVQVLDEHLGAVIVHQASVATSESRTRWASASLPLFDVEAPRLDGLQSTWGV